MNMAAVTEQTTEAFDWKLIGEVEFTETSLIAYPWYGFRYTRIHIFPITFNMASFFHISPVVFSKTRPMTELMYAESCHYGVTVKRHNIYDRLSQQASERAVCGMRY